MVAELRGAVVAEADSVHSDVAADAAKAETKRWWDALQSLTDTWASRVGLALAPEGEFVQGSALVDIAVKDMQASLADTPLANDFLGVGSERQYVLVRNAANRMLGRIQQRRAPFGVCSGVHWNVTCSSLPSMPFPVTHPVGQTNKKDRRAAKRVAKGLPAVATKDKETFRILAKDDGPHFTRYTNEFLQLTCAPLLLELKLFPNAKELTESFACFAAARAHLSSEFNPRDPTVAVVCVGDGFAPRTAALFAFRTAWRCISVDPLMEERPDGVPSWSDSVNRLEVHRARIEDIPMIRAERVLVVLTHAHVGLEASFSVVRWRHALGAIAMPCCNFYKALSLPDAKPLVEQEDAGVVSPHRLVRAWLWTATTAESRLPSAVPRPDDGATTMPSPRRSAATGLASSDC
mmetsp:Transcript_36858/g.93917  ORF Transcript_36858/g.93917 Transcript_36858/m.93917 type:complete len:406 (+) Transcript_36858:108-1325(+)